MHAAVDVLVSCELAPMTMDMVGPVAAIRYLEALLDDALPPAPRTGLLRFLCYFAAVSGDLDRVERAIADLPPPGERGMWEHVVLAMPAWRAVLLGDHEAALSTVAAVHDMMSEWEGTIMLFDIALISMMAESAASMLPGPGSPRAESIASHILALAALARGDVSGATTTAIAGLLTGSDGYDITAVIDLLEVLACCSEPDRCVRLSAAVRRLRDDTGYVLRPAMLVERSEHALEEARRKLGDARHDELWAEGTAMSLHGAIDYVLRGRGRRGRPASGWPSLTPTETIVVELVAEGLTNPQIAQRMLVELSTVKTHVHHIFTKLGVTSRAELASAAVRRSRQPEATG